MQIEAGTSRDGMQPTALEEIQCNWERSIPLSDLYPGGLPASWAPFFEDLRSYDPRLVLRMEPRSDSIVVWRELEGRYPPQPVATSPFGKDLDNRLIDHLRETDLRRLGGISAWLKKANGATKERMERDAEAMFASVRDESVWKMSRVLGVVRSQVPANYGD